MKRVTGIGGIFFKSDDPKGLQGWYEKHLGLPSDQHGFVVFQWKEKDNPQRTGNTIWSAFPRDTKYFSPGDSPYMVNYRVENLDALLAALKEEGVWVDEKREDSEYGKFGWIQDPEGNRIELWQPPESELEVPEAQD